MTIAPVGSVTSLKSAANSSTTLTVNKPTGVLSGHVLIGTLIHKAAGATVTAPSGFTEVHHAIDTGPCALYRWIRVAGSSEPSTYTCSWDTSGGGIFTVEAYSGVDNATPIVSGESGIATTDTSTATVRTTPTITTAGTRAILSAFANPYAYTWSGATDTQLYNDLRSGAVSLLTQYAVGVAAGSISRSATTSGNVGDGVQSIIALNPASTVLTATSALDVSSGVAPLTVTRSISAAGGSGTYTFSYTWGDGATDLNVTASSKAHTYSTPGTYTAGWSVTDG
jgi:hypothetical protein